MDVTDVDLEICAIRVHRVGKGLPCLLHSKPNARDSYAKSDPSRKFDDFGSVNLGSACPVNYPGGDASSANQFTASMYWRLPQNQVRTSDKLFLGGGIRAGQESVWASAEEYTLADTLEKETLGILAQDNVEDPSKTITTPLYVRTMQCNTKNKLRF